MSIVTASAVVVASVVLALGSIGMAQAELHEGTNHGDATTHVVDVVTPTGNPVSRQSVDRIVERGGLPRLRGFVGPGTSIGISDNRVPRGRYRIIVKDEATGHNWHVTGQGVDKETTVSGTGRWSWRVRLRAGTYTVVCDRHPLTMRFTITVT